MKSGNKKTGKAKVTFNFPNQSQKGNVFLFYPVLFRVRFSFKKRCKAFLKAEFGSGFILNL